MQGDLTSSRGLFVAVLGAGAGQRFGGGKLDTDFRGQSLGLWAVRAALDLSARCAVVAGLQPPAFLASVQDRLEVLANPQPERGLGSSIALTARWAQREGAERLLILLGDMPLVTTTSLRELIRTAPAQGASACVYPNGRLGPPACFSAALFDRLAGLDGDSGARALLESGIAVSPLAIDPAQLVDIDTPQDLAALSRPGQEP